MARGKQEFKKKITSPCQKGSDFSQEQKWLTSDFVLFQFVLVLLMHLGRQVLPRLSRFRLCCQLKFKRTQKSLVSHLCPLYSFVIALHLSSLPFVGFSRLCLLVPFNFVFVVVVVWSTSKSDSALRALGANQSSPAVTSGGQNQPGSLTAPSSRHEKSRTASGPAALPDASTLADIEVNTLMHQLYVQWATNVMNPAVMYFLWNQGSWLDFLDSFGRFWDLFFQWVYVRLHNFILLPIEVIWIVYTKLISKQKLTGLSFFQTIYSPDGPFKIHSSRFTCVEVFDT